MQENDLKIDSSEEGKVIITVKDLFEDKFLTGTMCCNEKDKKLLLEQFNKLLNDPKMVGLDFFDCMPVFERICTFGSQVFDMDETVYNTTAEWIKSLNIPSNVDVIIWADGEPSMIQFNDIVNGMYDAANLGGDAMVSYNGKPLEDADTIRFSIWY